MAKIEHYVLFFYDGSFVNEFTLENEECYLIDPVMDMLPILIDEFNTINDSNWNSEYFKLIYDKKNELDATSTIKPWTVFNLKTGEYQNG